MQSSHATFSAKLSYKRAPDVGPSSNTETTCSGEFFLILFSGISFSVPPFIRRFTRGLQWKTPSQLQLVRSLMKMSSATVQSSSRCHSPTCERFVLLFFCPWTSNGRMKIKVQKRRLRIADDAEDAEAE